MRSEEIIAMAETSDKTLNAAKVIVAMVPILCVSFHSEILYHQYDSGRSEGMIPSLLFHGSMAFRSQIADAVVADSPIPACISNIVQKTLLVLCFLKAAAVLSKTKSFKTVSVYTVNIACRFVQYVWQTCKSWRQKKGRTRLGPVAGSMPYWALTSARRAFR